MSGESERSSASGHLASTREVQLSEGIMTAGVTLGDPAVVLLSEFKRYSLTMEKAGYAPEIIALEDVWGAPFCWSDLLVWPWRVPLNAFVDMVEGLRARVCRPSRVCLRKIPGSGMGPELIRVEVRLETRAGETHLRLVPEAPITVRLECTG